MAKQKEKKNDLIVNKEFEQVLSALNPGENLEIERPQASRGAWLWIVFALVVAVAAATVWFFVLRPASGLADQLPGETSFYFSLALPEETRWYDRVFFWRASVMPSRNLSRLYAKLDFISWPGVDWQKQISLLLKDKIEMARLDDGTIILKARLKDKDGWLALTKAGAGSYSQDTKTYQGEITQPSDQATYFGGWWKYLTKNPNKISWLIKNNDLYISDQPNFESYLGQKRALPKFERGIVQAFIKDKTAFAGLDASFGQFFAPGNGYPLKLIARNVNHNLVWQFGSADKSFIWDEVSAFAPSFDSPFAVTGRNIGQAYAQWQSSLALIEPNQLTKNINELSQITKEFYNLDLETVFNKIGSQEVILEPVSGNEWLFRIKGSQSEIDNELLEYLQKFASALFAVSHPQAKEHKLSDGTAMVELRATREGLEWQPLEWTSNGQQYSFYSLRGQGEEAGYFIGFIPAKGYFLASSLSLISQALESEDAPARSAGCSLPFKPDLRLVFAPAFISSETLFNQIISKLTLAATVDGRLAGCVQF